MDSFCLDALRIEELMARDDYRIVGFDSPARGTTDVHVLTFAVRDRGKTIRFRAKWKPAPEDGDGFNNSPRKEAAAYELQKLFLDPDEYVVPPTLVRCVPLDRARKEYHARDAKPTFPGIDCVLGTLTYWIENVTDERLLHLHRFQHDAEYRRHISHLNLLTYIIDHRDTHDGNFLISTDVTNPRAFSIDNGLAFSGLRNPIPLLEDVPNWSSIVVPALPRRKIDVLRSITRAQLDALGTVVQLRPENGILVPDEVEPPFDPNEGVRARSGVVQLGLTKEEIDGLEERIRELVRRIEQRKMPMFE